MLLDKALDVCELTNLFPAGLSSASRPRCCVWREVRGVGRGCGDGKEMGMQKAEEVAQDLHPRALPLQAA